MATPLTARLPGLKRELGAVAGFSLFLNLLLLTAPIYMMQVFDRVLASGRVETLLFLTLIAGLALVVLGFLDVIRGRMLSRLANWADARLTPDILRTSMTRTLAGSEAGSQGLNDLGKVRGFLGGNGINALFDVPWLPFFTIVIWMMHPLLGVVAVVGAVLLFALALVNELLTRKTLSAAAVAVRHDGVLADAIVRNAAVVRAMGMNGNLMARWRKGHADALSTQGAAQERNATMVGVSKALRLFLQVAILGVGAYLVITDRLSAGGMIAASILLSRALAPVEQSIVAWKQFVGARDGWRALSTLLAGVPVNEPRQTELPRPSGRLDVEGVSWQPPGAPKPVVVGVSMQLKPGELCGLIGPSGSGKSSLCRLIVGAAVPQRGQVRIDGGDVARWDADALGRHIGYLPQTVDLFAGTVADNIARMGEADDEAIVEAAKLAGAHEMIMRLPDRYDTSVGRAGERLSGGQRQRIGLARALFGHPVLLVLDEPNAHLDAEGEAALLQALRQMKANGTAIIVVAHGPAALRDADKVALMREGVLQAFGDRDEVLKRLRGAQVVPAQAGVGAAQQQQVAASQPAAVQQANVMRIKASGAGGDAGG